MTPHTNVKREIKNNAGPGQEHSPTLDRARQITQSNERRAEVMGFIRAMKLRGNNSLVGIANELNRRGIPALRGGQWSATQVSRLI